MGLIGKPPHFTEWRLRSARNRAAKEESTCGPAHIGYIQFATAANAENARVAPSLPLLPAAVPP
jgi:hypothetical protein